jgi:predicted dehydrogenase
MSNSLKTLMITSRTEETMNKIKWGILSTANIAVNRVIAAMQKSELGEVVAIASRHLSKAFKVAQSMGIEKAYGSYEELLRDPNIDAIYNPLPNHLHLPYTLAALEAGKHVLVEKPFTCNAAEAWQLLQAGRRHPELKVMEAFMYRFHPQWAKIRELIAHGAIGDLRTVHSWFSFYDATPDNYRQNPAMGGGGMLDVGCYCISVSRLLFQAEPLRVMGLMEFDPRFGIDRLASGLMEFPNGTASFTCATQLADGEYVHIFGDKAALVIETPFIPPTDRPARLFLQVEKNRQEISVAIADHFTLQADSFNRAVLQDVALPWSVEDAWANMRVIDAIISSAKQNEWVSMA